MRTRIPDRRPDPPTTAVVQVAADGTATLYLGSELVEHAAGVDASAVMRVLVDYAATIDSSVRVTTQMADGTWSRHRLDPDGTLTSLPRNLLPARTGGGPVYGCKKSPRARRQVWRGRAMQSVTSRGWLLAVLLLLIAALVAVVVTT
jgi:hypothetical protein